MVQYRNAGQKLFGCFFYMQNKVFCAILRAHLSENFLYFEAKIGKNDVFWPENRVERSYEPFREQYRSFRKNCIFWHIFRLKILFVCEISGVMSGRYQITGFSKMAKYGVLRVFYVYFMCILRIFHVYFMYGRPYTCNEHLLTKHFWSPSGSKTVSLINASGDNSKI